MEERILVVDDEKDICDILQFNLENEGYINIKKIQTINMVARGITVIK